MKVNIPGERESVSVSSAGWKQELDKASSGYHIKAAWAAIIFDPLFAITDYINIPEGWLQIFYIRLSVSLITLGTLQLKKRYNLPSYVIVLIPFLLISLQNAYTYSLIGSEDILGHNLNYMALLVGCGMFVLWELIYSVGLIMFSALATAWFIQTNPAISVSQFFMEGGLLLAAVGVFMIILIKTRYDLTVKEIKARMALKESNEELEKQKEIVELKNEKITDSIQYAKRIQDSILGNQAMAESWFRDSFVYFKPKDVLSGDFYWFYENPEDKIKIVIAGDCTGHGVPAALMTVMGNSILNDIVVQHKIYEPDKILQELDKRITERFNNGAHTERKVNDGMDVSILTFWGERVLFGAAKNPLCIIRNGEANVIKGSKYPIGSSQYKEKKVFEMHEIAYQKGDKLYIYSDGFQDQFGGEKDMKYLTKRFREYLQKISVFPMAQQKLSLDEEFLGWKGQNRQTDDILIVGLEL